MDSTCRAVAAASAAEGKDAHDHHGHGGPAAAVTPGFAGPGTVSALLQHGYALFRPKPRGSYGQGERFTQANVRDFGHGDLRDSLPASTPRERRAPSIRRAWG